MTPLPAPPPDPDAAFILHAVVDAAQDPSIFPTLCRAGRDAVVIPLFDGATARELATVAPYLVELEPESPLADWLAKTADSLFFWSSAPVSDLRAHFRRLTKIKTETGETVFLRFYDPRILRALLRACTPDQRRLVFGPVAMYVTANAGGLPQALTLDAPASVEPAGMLRLSDAQMTALAATLENDFIDRLVTASREALPDETASFSDPALRDQIIESVEDALSFDLSREGPISTFVGLALQYGPSFHEHPLVSTALLDEASEEDRIESLLADVSEEEWAEIETFGMLMRETEG